MNLLSGELSHGVVNLWDKTRNFAIFVLFGLTNWQKDTSDISPRLGSFQIQISVWLLHTLTILSKPATHGGLFKVNNILAKSGQS